jgi:hypothetical protein
MLFHSFFSSSLLPSSLLLVFLLLPLILLPLLFLPLLLLPLLPFSFLLVLLLCLFHQFMSSGVGGRTLAATATTALRPLWWRGG